jgi:2-hydroxy-3-keto-5-methylthiopentenyl-1-phosphate phosphatase
MNVASVLVDFDGTACPLDVFTELCDEFIGDDWEQAFERASWKGTATLREDIVRLARLLEAPSSEMLDFVVGRFGLEPGFAGFVQWAEEQGAQVTIVSDGLGFYIEPMLEAAGIVDLQVITNSLTDAPAGLRLAHPFAHPQCVGCGTCKMWAVLDYRERRGPVAFIGDGGSDRFAALYADVVFAKAGLARICTDQGIEFTPWTDFGDVRASLEACLPVKRAPASVACPGWTTTATDDSV